MTALLSSVQRFLARAVLVGGSCVAVLLPITAVGPATAYAGSSSVQIAAFRFWPHDLKVPLGTTVMWTNESTPLSVPHTATSNTGIWDSKVLNPGQSYQFTFKTAGTYAYHCTIHPFMKGIITVQ